MPSRVDARELGLPETGQVVGLVGRINRWKGDVNCNVVPAGATAAFGGAVAKLLMEACKPLARALRQATAEAYGVDDHVCGVGIVLRRAAR